MERLQQLEVADPLAAKNLVRCTLPPQARLAAFASKCPLHGEDDSPVGRKEKGADGVLFD